MTTATLSELEGQLYARANPETAATLQRFFRTGPGEYGHGDRFLGLRVPELRSLARGYRSLPVDDVLTLLRSPWHEARLTALLILVEQYRRGIDTEREGIHQAYLDHAPFINNWDLVDTSAEHILGAHLHPNRIDELESLAASESVWERRMAILATFHWIKRGEFGPTLSVARLLLHDPHDLIHKAVGWMLREVGKRAPQVEEDFLLRCYREMPRTMLRYAIERFPESRRQQYLRGEV